MRRINTLIIGIIAIFGIGIVIGSAMAMDLPSMWDGSTTSDTHGGMMGGDEYMMGAENDCHESDDGYMHMHDHIGDEDCHDGEDWQTHMEEEDCHDDEDLYSHMHDHMHSHSEEECLENVVEQP